LTTTDWTNEPGTLIWIACSQKTIVWGLDEDHEIWFHTPGTLEERQVDWEEVPGMKMIKIDVGREGRVLGLDDNAEIWWRQNISPENKKGDSWGSHGNLDTFQAFDVAICTTGNQFARGLDGNYYMRTAVRNEDLRGEGWAVVPGSDIQGPAYITCGLNGDLWTLEAPADGTPGNLYRRVGVTRHDPDGDSWELVVSGSEMHMQHVSLGETGELWMTDVENRVYRRTDMTDENPNGSGWEEIGGEALEQVDVGLWEVWGVNIYNEVYRREDLSAGMPQGSQWISEVGTMIYVSTAERGVAWALDVEGDVWIYVKSGSICDPEVDDDCSPYNPEDDDFVKVEPQDRSWKAVEVGRFGLVLAIDSNHDLYHREGTPNKDEPIGTGWTNLEDTQNFKSVSVCGTGRFWAVSEDGNGVFTERMFEREDNGAFSQEFAVIRDYQIKSISCGKHGFVWMTLPDGTVQRRADVDAMVPSGTDVVAVNGEMKSVSIGLDGEVWAVGMDGSTYRRSEVTDYTPHGSGWSLISAPSNMQGSDVLRESRTYMQISVGDCQVMALNENHELYRRRGLSPENKDGDDWEQLGGKFIYLSVGFGPVVWVIDEYDRVYFKQWGAVDSDDDHPSDRWDPVHDMRMIQLDVGRDGHVWGVATDGLVYRRMGIEAATDDTEQVHKGTHWEQIPDTQTGAVVKVDMCTTGRVWALRQNGDVNDVQFREGVSIQDTVGSHWSNVEGTMRDISCGYDGQVWAISEGGAMYIREDISYTRPKGNGWMLVDSSVSYRSVGVGSENHQLWAVREDFTIVMRTGITNRNDMGSEWVDVDGYLA
jgi:hypothetical protein